MPETCETTDAPSNDQQAVIDYLNSGRYARRMRPLPPLVDGRRSRSIPQQHLPWSEREFSPAESFWFGLLGLNAFLVLIAAITPLGFEVFEWWAGGGRPTYIVMLLTLQTLMFPAMIGYSFVTVTPMFWYGLVTLRFITAAISVVPACLAFGVSFAITQNVGSDTDFWHGFVSVMFAQFLVAGTISLIIQLWSPWTLSHARETDEPLPPLGTRAMMELTVVAAIGFTVFALVDTAAYMEGLLMFAGLGGISSVAVISIQTTFLREGEKSRRAIATAGLSAFLTAFLFSATFAALEFGWESIGYNWVTVSAVSLYGGTIVFGVIWICIRWLGYCGWTCVNRRTDALVTGRHEPVPR